MENQTVFCLSNPSRISSSSTNDLSSDSDEENLGMYFKLDDVVKYEFFIDIDDELKCYYIQLNEKLGNIYSELEKELEPVCIREQCTLPSKRISIIGTSGSLITKRRISMSTILH